MLDHTDIRSDIIQCSLVPRPLFMRREKGYGNIAYSELYQRNSIIADVDVCYVNATYILLRKLFARALDVRNDDNAHSFSTLISRRAVCDV